LLDAAVHYKIKKFVYISTDEIYGSIAQGSFSESDNFNPSSPYSASKAAAELLVLSYSKTYGLKFNITRSSNNYGPRQNKEKLIPNFIDLLMGSKPMRLYGDGLNVRDWIYVEDNCDAIYKILCGGRINQIYNISSGEEISNLSIAKKLLELFKVDDSYIEFVADRPGHDFRYSISSKKIKDELGYHPKVKFDSGILKTIAWYGIES
jgi:dTDP-glucose 4,6-dehydratase